MHHLSNITHGIFQFDHSSPPHGKAGFTLLEVVIAILLLGMITAIGGMGIALSVQSYETSRTNIHIAQKAQLAVIRISRELMELTDIIAVSDVGDPFIIYERLAEGSTTAMERYGIHHHRASDTLRLYTNLNPIITNLDNSTINQSDVLIDGLGIFTLSFFQGQTPLSLPLPADIRLLSTIDLTLTLTRPDRPGTTQDFQNRIHLRNTNNFGGAAPTTAPLSQGDYSCFINSVVMDLAL